MAGSQQIFPSWSSEQGPVNVSLGSPVNNDFKIVSHDSEYEIMTSLEWIGLSRQEVMNLRNLSASIELKEFLSAYTCGISTGIKIDTASAEDPNDAKFGLMLSTEQPISQTLLGKMADFVLPYRVP